MDRILECVTNFSQGRDKSIIEALVLAIDMVEGAKVLHVDMGYATNRTVITFAGEPEGVVEAAFTAVKVASEKIDMRHHKGKHPRIGATDVLPLVPIRGITLEQTACMARELAARISSELGIPTYTYEASASDPRRCDLAYCRKGEYEGLPEKIVTADGRPDFGEASFTEIAARCGATVVGARNLLVAVNFNLNTVSSDIATDIALDVRERGRAKRKGDSPNGEIERDSAGAAVMIPGALRGTKAIGWYIEEYGFAQVSMNIVDIDAAPLHIVFEEVGRIARLKGVEVTGTEIIGLVPLRALTDAGRYFAAKAGLEVALSQTEQVEIAIQTMGLNQISLFRPRERIIEYLIDGPGFSGGKSL